MPTTVTPTTFVMVDYDAARITEIADRLAATIGLPADVEITIAVDETTPLGRSRLLSVDPIRIEVESGAMEDARRTRQFSEDGAVDILGRHLLRAKDRRGDGFASAPADDELSLVQRAAWEVHAVGRLARAGFPTNRQRWLYAFRNRHGFTDLGDDIFEQLWHAAELTWAELAELSDRALAANPGRLNRKPA